MRLFLYFFLDVYVTSSDISPMDMNEHTFLVSPVFYNIARRIESLII